MKYLLLILIFALPIYGQKESTKTNSQQKHPESVSTPSSSPVGHNTTPENSDGAANDPKGYFHRLFSPENLPNIGLFIAGIVGIYVAVGTLKHMQESAGKQLRAYMGLKGSRLFLHDDGTVEPKIEVVNCGQTPAYEFQGAHYARFSPYPVPPPGRPPANTRVSAGIVGAGFPYYLLGKIQPSGESSREGVITALSRPDFVFCLNGYYTYRDIFRDTHHLEFQLIIGGPSGVPRSDKTESGELFLVFANDSVGNDAD